MPGISPKKSGNQFEELFYRAAIRSNIGIVRIADGCKRIGTFKRFRLIPVKQAADWIVSFNGKTAVLDTKTLGTGKTFPYASINQDQVHAIRSLVLHGTIGGYVCFLRQIDRLVFFDTDKLMSCHPGTSLAIADGKDLGSLENPDLKKIFE